jgi:hypothetical protein
MGLLRTILIIVVVYYGIKVLSRIFAPFLVKYASKKMEKKFGEQFGGFQKPQQQEAPKKEGEVIIDKIPKTKTSNKDVGEYVDYEEIE